VVEEERETLGSDRQLACPFSFSSTLPAVTGRGNMQARKRLLAQAAGQCGRCFSPAAAMLLSSWACGSCDTNLKRWELGHSGMGNSGMSREAGRHNNERQEFSEGSPHHPRRALRARLLRRTNLKLLLQVLLVSLSFPSLPPLPPPFSSCLNGLQASFADELADARHRLAAIQRELASEHAARVRAETQLAEVGNRISLSQCNPYHYLRASGGGTAATPLLACGLKIFLCILTEFPGERCDSVLLLLLDKKSGRQTEECATGRNEDWGEKRRRRGRVSGEGKGRGAEKQASNENNCPSHSLVFWRRRAAGWMLLSTAASTRYALFA